MTLRSSAKRAVRAILPTDLASFIQACRYRGYWAHVDYVLKERRYRAQHAKANTSVSDSIVLPEGCRIRIPPDIRDAFEHFGWRDPEMVDEFIGFMKVSSGRKTLWDVGALYGIFSLAFTLKEKGRRAVAFEPNPESRMKLEKCLALNPDANVKVCSFPVGLPGQVVEFETGFHYTAAAGLTVRPDEHHLTRIETVSIDELIETGFAPPDIIKIDVEGLESEVLHSAEKLLHATHPLLSLELHPGLLIHKGTSPLAIAQFLEDAGYQFRDTQLRRVKRAYFNKHNNFRVFAMRAE